MPYFRAIATLACTLLLSAAAEAAAPVALPGTSWVGTAVFKGKLPGAGSTGGPVDFMLDFGPNAGAGLSDGEFRMAADDGMEVFEIEGTFGVDAKGRPVLTPDTVALADQLKQLMSHICRDVLLLGSQCDVIDTLTAVVDPTKLKLAVKTRAGVPDTLQLGAKIPFVLTDGIDAARVTISLKTSPPAVPAP